MLIIIIIGIIIISVIIDNYRYSIFLHEWISIPNLFVNNKNHYINLYFSSYRHNYFNDVL